MLHHKLFYEAAVPLFEARPTEPPQSEAGSSDIHLQLGYEPPADSVLISACDSGSCMYAVSFCKASHRLKEVLLGSLEAPKGCSLVDGEPLRSWVWSLP